MNRLTFYKIKYMNGRFFSKARHMIGVDFKILACRPVPKLPQSYTNSVNVRHSLNMIKGAKILAKASFRDDMFWHQANKGGLARQS